MTRAFESGGFRLRLILILLGSAGVRHVVVPQLSKKRPHVCQQLILFFPACPSIASCGNMQIDRRTRFVRQHMLVC
jgi:hypothetical protein